MSTNFAKTLVWKQDYDVILWRHKQRTPNTNDYPMPLNETPPHEKFLRTPLSHRQGFCDQTPVVKIRFVSEAYKHIQNIWNWSKLISVQTSLPAAADNKNKKPKKIEDLPKTISICSQKCHLPLYQETEKDRRTVRY